SSVDSKGLSWVETERGLRELGMRFMHSRRPLSKPVERVIGQLQDLLDGEPGDAGRNEMKDGFERLQDRKRQAERGEVAASDYFYSYDQWTERLTQFCEEYNNARNDGKMTRGLTPFQAWGHFQTDPLVKLPPEARYLLSHHKRPTTVGRNGITLRFGKRNFTYRNAKTGELRGRQVLAWFNPELPELLAVTDMNRENCFTVERSEDVPATDAPEDMLQREMERMAAHNGYARQRYRTLARLANLNPRPTIMDRPTAELGRAIESQAKEVRAKRHERRNLESVGRAVLVDAGITPRSMNGLRPEQIEAAKRLKQARQEFKQKHLHE
ncbi:MAG TPA: hypothetical protein VL981_05620, partial [Candidatus Methylacidiphilales bacterium]|nr:hypothetical protein [Candidatus Methylacidiphilales bacterium]